jgi:hypothetical protein
MAIVRCTVTVNRSRAAEGGNAVLVRPAQFQQQQVHEARPEMSSNVVLTPGCGWTIGDSIFARPIPVHSDSTSECSANDMC